MSEVMDFVDGFRQVVLDLLVPELRHVAAAVERNSEAIKEINERLSQHIARTEKRFARVDERFASVDEQIADFRKEMNERFAQMDKRFAQMDERFARVDEHLMELRGQYSKMMLTLNEVLNRLDNREKISELEANMNLVMEKLGLSA